MPASTVRRRTTTARADKGEEALLSLRPNGAKHGGQPAALSSSSLDDSESPLSESGGSCGSAEAAGGDVAPPALMGEQKRERRNCFFHLLPPSLLSLSLCAVCFALLHSKMMMHMSSCR